MARILKDDSRSIALAAKALLAGDPVALPTETVYGLAARFDSTTAVESVFRAKGRPASDPLIVHVRAGETLESLDSQGLIALSKLSRTGQLRARRLIKAFWPGPLTLVLPRGPRVALEITGGRDFVAIRQPAHPVFQAILAKTRVPLVAPSANRFQGISPTRPEHVLDELRDRIDLVVDGGPCSYGIESTIVWVRSSGLSLLRPGSIPYQRLSKVAGTNIVRPRRAARIAPGMGAKHYAPSKPVVLATGTRELAQKAVALVRTYSPLGVLTQSAASAARLKKRLGPQVVIEVASPRGEPKEIARALYGCLRRLDASVCDMLLLEMSRSKAGLLHAVHDRLTRAGGKSG